MASFIQVGSSFVEHKFPLTLYRNTISGAKVVIVDHPSPTIKAEISFVTALEDNSGLGHTLEHLLFMGSENYPCAQFLTNLASRSYGHLNAVTRLDNTVFEIKIIGSEGFLKLLPIYLDHLFNPLLTESSYITEVHHINGEGQDGGVVYSEMNKENSIEILRVRALTLGENSPFSKCIGGNPKDIRETCNLERIKAYHKKFYRMENMIISIVGTVPHQKVLEAVEEFQNSNGFVKKKDFVRPFEDYIPPPLTGITVQRMEVPSKDKSGTVYVCWRGPDLWEEDIFPISILLKYFTAGRESLLYRHFVTRLFSVCSDISTKIDKHKACFISFIFKGVNFEFLLPERQNNFKQDLIKLMKNHNFDLKKIHGILKSKIENIGKFLEDDISDAVFSDIRLYQNYAPGISPDFDELKYLASREVEKCKKALTYGEEYWKQLVDKYFNEDYIVLYTIPSETLIEKEKMEEDERLKKQVEELGPEGLKRCGEILERAVAANKASGASTELLKKYEISELTDFTVIPVERSFKNDENGSIIAPIIVHKTESSFIKFKLIFNSEAIPKHLYPLVRLFVDLLSQSSALIDEKLVPYEELLTKRKVELLDFDIYCCQNKIIFNITSTLENTPKVPFWIDTYLNKVVFEKKVIEDILKRIKTFAMRGKGDEKINVEILCNLLVDIPGTLDYHNRAVESQLFHWELLEQLNDDEFVDKLIEKLKEFKEHFLKTDVNLHLIGNPDGIDELDFSSWPPLSGEDVMIYHPEKFQDYSKGAGKAYCISRAQCSSAHFKQFVHFQLDFKSPEYTYSNLLNMYFCGSSGSVHNEVRGKGFAYHVGLTITKNIGLELLINNATNLLGAYEATKKCICETIESGKLNSELFEAAKRSLTRLYINTESTIRQAGDNSYYDHMNGFKFDENQTQIRITHIKEVTTEKVLKSVGKIYLDLFDDSKCGKAMVIPTAAEESIKEAFPNVEFKGVRDLVRDIDRESILVRSN